MKTLKFAIAASMLCIIFNSCDRNKYAPQILFQIFSIEENSPEGTVVCTVIANDNDEGQKLGFEIINGDEDNVFVIDPESGRILVAKAHLLDFEKTEQFQLTVSVTDNHKKDPLESAANIQIDIINVNEIPQAGIQAFYNCDGNPFNDGGTDYHFADPGLEYGTDRKNKDIETFIFDGSQGLTLLSQEFNNQSEPQSVSLWFKTASPNSVDYGGLLFGALGRGASGTGSRFLLSMKEGIIRAGYGDEWADDNKWNENLEWDVPLNDNTWHHLVFIGHGDGQLAYLFVDNELVVMQELSKSNNSKTEPIDLKIGGDKAQNYFTGEVDEVIYYHRALTATEVNTIYVEAHL